ncbi:hypothetical protein, conserved [Babesia bigemina]|uniref:Uncharacterized protein n=1 Tax=Babesia bigemina TaxID=5866 RepID=A0A061DA04_BABBI|nr:hypothetical protein, conserved [Babesia bigemina]CDR97546.1 hypothetical protein, conserved [Babesia bigemina]|eukprot:XP_012769732.1 hypothetical protein, conserved [Babesia bigemina]
MWRSAKSSYSRYCLEMAEILCKCLKDPYREKALARYKLNVKQTDYTNGVAQSPQLRVNFDDAFGSKGPAQ